MKVATMLTAVAVACSLSATGVLAQSNADIQQVQKALKEKGHDPGQIDGRMGPRTSAALSAYQKEQGLEATGRVDDATLAKLGASAKAESQASRPPSSEQTGGDKKPSPVDPAQAKKTGANPSEGASYSRSTEKGLSSVKDGEPKADQKK